MCNCLKPKIKTQSMARLHQAKQILEGGARMVQESMGMLPASKAHVATERMKICITCAEFDVDNTKCKSCGCFLQAKTLVEKAKCPIGKW